MRVTCGLSGVLLGVGESFFRGEVILYEYNDKIFISVLYAKGRVNSYQCGGVKVYHSG